MEQKTPFHMWCIMRNHVVVSALALALGAALSSEALDLSESQLLDSDASRKGLEIEISPGVWVPRLRGDVRLGPSPAASDIALDETLDLDQSEPTFNLEIAIRKDDRWQIDLNGFGFSVDHSGAVNGHGVFGSLQLNDGDPYSATFEIDSASIELAYWFWQPYCFGETADGRYCAADLRFAPLIGFRYVDIDHSLRLLGEGEEKVGGEWIAAIVGGRMQLRYDLPDSFPLGEELSIDGVVGIGPAFGGDGGWVAHLRASLSWHFTHNFGVTVGYRLIHFNVEDGDFEFDGGLQGMFVGASLRF